MTTHHKPLQNFKNNVEIEKRQQFCNIFDTGHFRSSRNRETLNESGDKSII
jgi:hypothetical protein